MGQFSKMDRKSLVRQGKPVECLGLTFYPIKMYHYDDFLASKDALVLRLGTLPVKYAIKDYLNAIFSLEYDAVQGNGVGIGLFNRAISLLLMSLRIDVNLKEFIGKQVFIRQVGENDFEIDHIVVIQNNIRVEITPQDFSSQIRPLIAEQNGLELPNESDNAELVKAQEELTELNNSTKRLKQSTTSLIASVAYNSKVSEREIDEWTVREFENRRSAIERDKRYTLYSQAELSEMVSFKNGNPFPSWCYDTIDDTMGTMALSSLGNAIGGATQKQ